MSVKKSPCIECPNRNKKKNNEPCASCKRPYLYDKGLCDRTLGEELIQKSMEAPRVETSMEKPENIPQVQFESKPSYRTCDVPGCNKKHLAKGLCVQHYHEKKNRENVKKLKEMEGSPPEKKADIFTVSIPHKLAEEIKQIATKEYRTPEKQVHYFLDLACQEYNARWVNK